MDIDFKDWELLHPTSDSDSTHSVNSYQEFDPDAVFQTNYFSQDRPVHAPGENFDDNKSALSDNPSWIDPENSTRYVKKEPDEFWSDSSSDRSDNRKFNDFEGKNGMDFLKYQEKQIASQGIKENDINMENLEKFYADAGGMEVRSVKVSGFHDNSQVGVAESTNSRDGLEDLSQRKCEDEAIGDGTDNINGNGINKTGELEKRCVTWWKMPVEFLKYCMFRASPLWTVSIAAAVMGFVILSRRLYNMKKKTRGLEIKVTVDDKKVSQFMSRAARLNEAFSVVKRVPVIRPSLPAVGVQTWPVMSLR